MEEKEEEKKKREGQVSWMRDMNRQGNISPLVETRKGASLIG